MKITNIEKDSAMTQPSDDDTYRNFLMATVGKKSCKGLGYKDLSRVLAAMEAKGFKRLESSKGRGANKSKEFVRDPQAKKIRALWLMLAHTGVVRNSAEGALDNYVRRICGQGLDSASVKQCQAVIECLKKWAERVEDQRVAQAFAAILEGDMAAAAVIEGKIIAEVQGGTQ